MNDSQRSLFIDVAEQGSFSKAAQKRFVTPQSVSQQIRRLESELGVSLLDRTSQGVRLTDAGKVFFDGCRRIEQEIGELAARCVEVARAARQVIRLGMSTTYSLALFPRLVPVYLQSYPAARVEYADVGPSALDGLLEGAYDVVEGTEPTYEGTSIPDVRFAFLPLLASRRWALMSPLNPLSHLRVIEPADLVGERVYVYSSRWAEGLQRWLREHCTGIELLQVPSPDLQAVLELCDEASVFLVPEQLKDKYEALIPVSLDVDVKTEYGLVYLPEQKGRLADLLDVARRVFAAEAGAPSSS